VRPVKIFVLFGLILDWNFHAQGNWVSAYTPHLINEIVREFNPLIISSQLEYNLYKRKLRYILTFEPGWAAPRIKYDGRIECLKAVIYSDPHFQTAKRRQYFEENGFDYVFSL
jgi:hypothetical protein